MGAAHGLPVIHVRKEDSGSHNIVEACAGLGQGGLDLSEDVDGLTICISRGDDKTLFIHGSRARNCDPWTNADSPRISDNRFPLRTRRKVPAFHAVPAPGGPSSVPRKPSGGLIDGPSSSEASRIRRMPDPIASWQPPSWRDSSSAFPRSRGRFGGDPP